METGKQSALDPVNSPTLVNASIPGVIMGTAGYMAPEQAKGQPVDKRAEIDLKSLPETTPPSVRLLLTRCLDRNVKTRLRDIGEARILLSDPAPAPSIATPPPPQSPQPRPSYIPWVIAALLAAIPAAWFLKPKTELPLLQFEIPQPEGVSIENSFGLFALSPDRTTIVYRAAGSDQKQMLWLRRLAGSSWKSLPGTENGTRPFWSPDSRTIGFFAEGKMKRIEAAGGVVPVICDADPSGASWSQSGEIFFQQAGKPLLKVPAGGGKPEPIFPGDTEPQDGSEFFLLPDAIHFLYDKRTKDPGSHLGSLKDKSLDRLLIPGQLAVAKRAHYVPNPAGGGWILHTQNN